MTRRTRTGDGCGTAQRRIVIQSANSGDDRRLRVEELFSSCNLRSRLCSIVRIGVTTGVPPRRIERKRAGIKLFSRWVSSQRVIRTGVVALFVERLRPARCPKSMQRTRIVILNLCRGEPKLKLNDLV